MLSDVITEKNKLGFFQKKVPSNLKMSYRKICVMCGLYFDTERSNKNICSFDCKTEHVRQHSRFHARMKRNENLFGIKKIPCVICGFSETTDQHREGREVVTLCPNHHCLITRNIKTLKQLLLEKKG